MTSIRRHLTLRLVVAMLLIAGGGVAAIFAYLRHELIEQFDIALLSRARTLASLVRVDTDNTPTGRLEFEMSERSTGEYRAGKKPDYFEVWGFDGKALAKSESLATRDLPRNAENADVTRDRRARFFNLTLPDGRAGRAVEYLVEPGYEEDSSPTSAPAQVTRVPLVLATNTADLREALEHIFGGLLIVMGAVSVGTILTVVAMVRRGLRPLNNISDDVARIDPATLASRFDPNTLPQELRPIAEKLNELLVRLDAAFRRERRFTSNVAHELRTPIAELRSLAEVAINWPGDSEAASRNFQDALGIARQMESVVTALLAIARCAAGQQPLLMTTLEIADVVAESWRPHARAARSRDVQADVGDVSPAIVNSDRTVLSAIIGNLFANAVAYVPLGGKMGCNGRAEGDRYVLDIFNDNRSLKPADLPYIFEPFWRKDSARSDSSNSGLGLALVATYAELLGVELRASLPSSDTFAIRLELPLAPATATTPVKSATIPAPEAVFVS